jgi:hypothetical protein
VATVGLASPKASAGNEKSMGPANKTSELVTG